MKIKRLNGLSWWSAAFSVNLLFQFYRGSLQDIIIFSIALLLIILESTHVLDGIPEKKSLRSSKLNYLILISVGIYLLNSERGATLNIWIFTFLFIFMFVDLWRRENGEQRKLKANEIKSAKGLAVIGIALSIWELTAYVLASIYKDDYAFPTISVLISPYVDQLHGRAIFLVFWIAFGFVLLIDWREPE
jgi:hypothetical protein